MRNHSTKCIIFLFIYSNICLISKGYIGQKVDKFTKKSALEKSSPKSYNKIKTSGIMKNRLTQMKFSGEEKVNKGGIGSV